MMIPGLEIGMRRAFEQVLASEVGVNAVLHWRSVARAVGYDANDESSASAGVVTHGEIGVSRAVSSGGPKTVRVPAICGSADGRCDRGLPGSLALTGKEDVRIEVGGKFYVQKNASAGLLEAWDCEMGSGGTMKTLLLTPAA